MPVGHLFIATLFFFALLFPGRVLYFLRTIQTWLVYRQLQREAYENRKAAIYQANAAWKRYLDELHAQCLRLDTCENKVDQLRRALAAGQRYLTSVSPDECPLNYHNTKKFCRWAQATLAALDAQQP